MKSYTNFTRLVLVFVFLIILAGSIVRTTQSGMGCPDWPHCFGMWIPPLSSEQLPPDYKNYLSKQDIDIAYNPAHAWTEYINRLLTGMLGILILVHVIWSFKKFFKTNRTIFWLSCLFLVGTVFEAWLGKSVVDTNLEVVKITAHMLAALFLAIIPVLILHKLNTPIIVHDKTLGILTSVALIILLAQVIIGTDVREQVDTVSKSLGFQQRETWLSQLNEIFSLHKIVAIVTSVVVIAVFWRSLPHVSLQKRAAFLLLLVFALMAAGVSMASLNIPAFIQPIHLLLASLLFVGLFAFRMNVRR